MQRTITIDQDDHLTGAKPLMDFGLMTDGDWVDFQASPEFTATLERRKKETLKLRSDGMTYTDRSMEMIKRVGMTTLHDNLDMVCSMTKFSLEEFHSSQIGIGVKKELLNGKESFEVAPMTPDTMFEILRRNYMYPAWRSNHRFAFKYNRCRASANLTV